MVVQPSGKRAIQDPAEDTPPIGSQGGEPPAFLPVFLCFHLACIPSSALDHGLSVSAAYDFLPNSYLTTQPLLCILKAVSKCRQTPVLGGFADID